MWQICFPRCVNRLKHDHPEKKCAMSFSDLYGIQWRNKWEFIHSSSIHFPLNSSRAFRSTCCNWCSKESEIKWPDWPRVSMSYKFCTYFRNSAFQSLQCCVTHRKIEKTIFRKCGQIGFFFEYELHRRILMISNSFSKLAFIRQTFHKMGIFSQPHI